MPSDLANEFAPLATFDRPATDANAASRIEIRAVEPGNGLSSIARWSVRRVEKTGTSELEVERGVFGIDRGDDGFVARLAFRGLARPREVDETMIDLVVDKAAELGVRRLRIRGDSSIRVAMARRCLVPDSPAEFADALLARTSDTIRYRLDMDGWSPRVREPLVDQALAVVGFALARVEARLGSSPSRSVVADAAFTAVARGQGSPRDLLHARRIVTVAGPAALVDLTLAKPDGSGAFPIGEWLVGGISWSGRVETRDLQRRGRG